MLSYYRHSGENRNPVNPMVSGCRIKSGMTIRGLFAKSSNFDGKSGRLAQYNLTPVLHKQHGKG